MTMNRVMAKIVSWIIRPSPKKPDHLQKFKKLLVIRQHDQLGDMLCAVPLLHALRKSYPDARITLIASPVNYRVMEHHPYLDEVLCYDKKKYWKSPLLLLQFLRQLRSSAFDVAIVPATVSFSGTSDLLALISGAGMRIGPASLSGEKNPCANFYTHPVTLSWDSDPHRHQTLRNLDILGSLGISCEDLTLTMGFTQEEKRYGENSALSLRGNNPFLVGIHPGAGKPDNRWKAEYFAEIANKLSTERNASIVVTVGPMDDGPYSLLAKRLRCPHEVVYKKSLRTVASIISKFDLFLTNDTGIMHVAAATGTNIVALFGGTDPLQWAPKGTYVRYISMPNGDVNSISTETVWGEIDAILMQKSKHTGTEQ
jgi:heptosyltransferase-2